MDRENLTKICVKTEIRSSYEKVRSVLWDIREWTQFWYPVHKVEILYDDGKHQDFVMFLNWQAKETNIRTVRFLDSEGNIVFFSPKPPAPMRVHQGLWQLKRSENIELTATRWFELFPVEKESPEAYQKRRKEFSDGFVERLEKLVMSLGKLCEKSM